MSESAKKRAARTKRAIGSLIASMLALSHTLPAFAQYQSDASSSYSTEQMGQWLDENKYPATKKKVQTGSTENQSSAEDYFADDKDKYGDANALKKKADAEEQERVMRMTHPHSDSTASQSEDPSQGDHVAVQGKDNFLHGEVKYCVPKGTPIKLRLATVLAAPTELKMAQYDLDGNIAPATLGQEITARTAEDLYVDDSKVIPQGTIFHGIVTKLNKERRMRRPGSVNISFDSFETPDGRQFCFHAEANNHHNFSTKDKAKWTGWIVANAAGGAVVGALIAYQIFGLKETIAMHGYNIAGAAAGGAIIAAGCAMATHGHKPRLEPGEEISMEFDKDLLMPAAVEPTKQITTLNSQVEVIIHKGKMLNDGLQGHMLQLDVSIHNKTDHELNSIDLYCEDANGGRGALCMGPDMEDGHNSEFLFKVPPHSTKEERLYFEVQWPKLKRNLVWLSHVDQRIACKIPCPTFKSDSGL